MHTLGDAISGSKALNLHELREEASCDIRMDTHTHNLPTWAYHWSRLKMLVLSRWLLRRCIPCGPTKMTPLCRFLWNLRWAKYTQQVDQVVCHQGNQARPNGSRLFFQQALGDFRVLVMEKGRTNEEVKVSEVFSCFFRGRIMPWIDDVSAFLWEESLNALKVLWSFQVLADDFPLWQLCTAQFEGPKENLVMTLNSSRATCDAISPFLGSRTLRGTSWSVTE